MVVVVIQLLSSACASNLLKLNQEHIIKHVVLPAPRALQFVDFCDSSTDYRDDK